MSEKTKLKDYLESEQKIALQKLVDLHDRENTTEWDIRDEEERIRLRERYDMLTQIIKICIARNRF